MAQQQQNQSPLDALQSKPHMDPVNSQAMEAMENKKLLETALGTAKAETKKELARPPEAPKLTTSFDVYKAMRDAKASHQLEPQEAAIQRTPSPFLDPAEVKRRLFDWGWGWYPPDHEDEADNVECPTDPAASTTLGNNTADSDASDYPDTTTEDCTKGIKEWVVGNLHYEPSTGVISMVKYLRTSDENGALVSITGAVDVEIETAEECEDP